MALVTVAVRVRNATQTGLRSVQHSINGLNQRVTAGLGASFQGGIGQGIGNALRTAASNPIVAAGIAILALTIVTALAAALAGLLVVAFGGAFVALGIYLATQSKGVAKQWGKTLGDLKKQFVGAAAPMLPVLDTARHSLNRMGDEFAPHFASAMAKASPVMTTFIQDLQKGFEKFGKRAWDPLMNSFNVMMSSVMGPELEGLFSSMGKSFAALANTVRRHSVEVGLALHAIFGLIPVAIDTINFLTQAFVLLLRVTTATFGYILKAVSWMVQGIMDAFGSIIRGADKAFGWIPGIGGKIHSASEAFFKWGKDAQKTLDDVANKAINYGNTMDRENQTRILKMNISNWQSQIKLAKGQLKTVPKSQQSALKANIADLQKKVASAKASLRSITDKTVHLNIVTTHTSTGTVAHEGGGYAHGGIRGLSRAATGGARSNMTLVGENGPEVVNLAPGSHVRSNPDSRRLLSGGGGGGGLIQANLVLDGKVLASVLIDPLREEIRDRGGSPEKVLGRRP